jgi:predicted ATPase
MMSKDLAFLRGISLKREAIERFDTYPFNIPAVRELKELEFHPDITFIIGENGCGKSTLLEAIAVGWGFNAEGGSINFRFSTRASHSVLHRYLRPVRSARRPRDGFFLRAESFFNVATDIERMDKEPSFSPLSSAPTAAFTSMISLTASRFWRCYFTDSEAMAYIFWTNRRRLSPRHASSPFCAAFTN